MSAFAIAKTLLADGWKLVLADLARKPTRWLTPGSTRRAPMPPITGLGLGCCEPLVSSGPVHEGAILVEPPEVTGRDRRCRRVPARR